MTGDPCDAHGRRPFIEEVELTRQLMAQGDRAHALHHCLSALGLEPNLDDWKAPLRELLRDATLVARLRDDAFFGAQAAYAFHLHEVGSVAQAVALVAEIHQAAPHLGFHRWLAGWVEAAHAAGIEIDATPLLRVLMVGASFGVGRIRMLPSERAAAQELVPIARVAMALLPEDGRVALMASSVMRRAGHYDEALDAAERAKATTPAEQYQTVRGLALRASKQFDAALAAFEASFASSGDPVHLMEKMRVLADAGRWTEALEEWERCAALSPGDDGPSDENRLELAALEAAAEADAPPPSEPPLDIVRRRALTHGELFRMSDATANALRQVGENDGLRAKGPTAAGAAIRQGAINMTVSGPEGPSNRLCLALMLKGEPDPALATYTHTDGHDELTPQATEYTLWHRQGDVVVQALPSPQGNVLHWIEGVVLTELDGSVAEEQFHTSTDFLDMWNLASTRALPDASPREWTAAAVYPRMPLCRVCTGPDWVYRWQVGALIGLALSESGWEGTRKRDALLSLLDAPADWPLAAAIRVAAEVGLREPTAIREVRQTLLQLAARIGSEQNDGITRTLLGALEMLPNVPKEYADRLRAQLLGTEPPDDPVERVDTRPADTKKRPWWKFWGND